MNICYAEQHIEMNQDLIVDHRVYQAEYKFVLFLILQTIKEAYDLRQWYDGGAYCPRFYYQFGFNRNAQRERVFIRISEKIEYWLHRPEFERFCNAAEIDPKNARETIQQILSGNVLKTESLRPLLIRLKQETERYARRGPKTKEENC